MGQCPPPSPLRTHRDRFLAGSLDGGRSSRKGSSDWPLDGWLYLPLASGATTRDCVTARPGRTRRDAGGSFTVWTPRSAPPDGSLRGAELFAGPRVRRLKDRTCQPPACGQKPFVRGCEGGSAIHRSTNVTDLGRERSLIPPSIGNLALLTA